MATTTQRVEQILPENQQKFIDDLSIWERAVLVQKAKEKYNV